MCWRKGTRPTLASLSWRSGILPTPASSSWRKGIRPTPASLRGSGEIPAGKQIRPTPAPSPQIRGFPTPARLRESGINHLGRFLKESGNKRARQISARLPRTCGSRDSIPPERNSPDSIKAQAGLLN